MQEIEEAVRSQSGFSDGGREAGVKGAARRFAGLVRELGWKGNRIRVLIGVGLMAGQNLTGINGGEYLLYSPSLHPNVKHILLTNY